MSDGARDLPGPRSAEQLRRLRELLYPGTGEHLAPFVLDSKSGSTLTDLDGNEYVDLASASASVPLGAAREDLIEPLVAAAAPVRQRGRARDRHRDDAAAGREAGRDQRPPR